MEWLDKILGIKDKGKFECVYIKKGEWNVKTSGEDDNYDEFCEYQIHYNKLTNEYKFVTLGYKPNCHSLYEETFENYRSVCDGESYIKSGKIYPVTNETVHKRPTE